MSIGTKSLVLSACDGTNVNMADGGVKGLLENDMPWIVGFLCLCHKLELSLKDALNGTFIFNS